MKEYHYSYKKSSMNIALEQYVYRIGTYHYNWHRDLELLTVLNGRAEVCAGGSRWLLKEVDIILINSNQGHTTLAEGADTVAMILHLDPDFLKDYYEDVEYLSFHICSVNNPKKQDIFGRFRRDLAWMMLEAEREAPQSRLLFELAFFDLLYTMVSEFPPERMQSAAFKANQKQMDSVNKMIKYINKNYYKKLSLDTLARESGYNAGYVSQLFKNYVGINFYDYLTRIRLREATRALSQSDKTILEIALDHGFSDLKSFNSNFKENFKKSPTEYRKLLNTENRGNDLFFKQKFLEAGDPLVSKKLHEYLKYVYYSADGRQALQEQIHEMKTVLDSQARLMERLAAELTKAAADTKEKL